MRNYGSGNDGTGDCRCSGCAGLAGGEWQDSGNDQEQRELRELELVELIQKVVEILHPDDYTREGLERTPQRVAKYLMDFVPGAPPGLTLFDKPGEDQLIEVGGIEFSSLCEHHMLPFTGTASVSYVPSGKIVGLSKIVRVVQHFARRLTTQEALCDSVAGFLYESELAPSYVSVEVEARHSCMEIRGVRCKATTKVYSSRGTRNFSLSY